MTATVVPLRVKRGVNVGAGQRPFHSTPEVEWCNVDKVAHEGMPTPDIIADGASLPDSDSVYDYVVLHHVLEHAHCGGDGLIEEAYRVLRPGGSLLVFVPDMLLLAQGWREGKLTDQLYFTNVYGAYMGNDADSHHWGYTLLSMRHTLYQAAKWSRVIPFNWRTIPGTDIARDWWVCATEAIR